MLPGIKAFFICILLENGISARCCCEIKTTKIPRVLRIATIAHFWWVNRLTRSYNVFRKYYYGISCLLYLILSNKIIAHLLNTTTWLLHHYVIPYGLFLLLSPAQFMLVHKYKVINSGPCKDLPLLYSTYSNCILKY